MDPIITALLAGARMVGSNFAKKATEDLYSKLKTLIINRYHKNKEIDDALRKLEANPQSQGRQKVLKEELDSSKAGQDKELLEIAREFLKHVEINTNLPKEIVNLIRIYNSDVQININENRVAKKVTEGLLEQTKTYQANNASFFNTTEKYMAYLLNRYKFMDFRGMGTLSVPLNVMLQEMYVPLEARIGLPEGGTWTQHFRLRGKSINAEEVDAFGPQLNKPLPLIDLLKDNKNRVLVILGDPGTGKTTFIKYITIQLAQGNKLGIGLRLPVLVPLSAYANALTEGDIPLMSFISDYYSNILGDSFDFKPILYSFLEQGKAAILLDGLDEVHSLDQRIFTMNRVNDFLSSPKCQNEGNKFVLTSRVIGYNAVRPMTGKLLECVLSEFNQSQVKNFINNWSTVIARIRYENDEIADNEAEPYSEKLIATMFNDYNTNKLTTNPLLLTILLLLLRQKLSIPEQRVELYNICARTLIKDWHNARSLHQPFKYPLSVQRTLRILSQLAFWLQGVGAGAGIFREYSVRNKLQEIFSEQGEMNFCEAAEEFLNDVIKYTALFIKRGNDTYGFMHLSFQEFLAAMHLAESGQSNIVPISNTILKCVDNEIWHEVIRLTIAYIGVIQNRYEVASDILKELLDYPSSMATILAGNAALDALPDGITKKCKEQVIEKLENVLTGTAPSESPFVRSYAGNLLAKLGDPRNEILDIDKMVFCYIPKGEFWEGDENHAVVNSSLEYCYWIGRFPVTVSQYKNFVESTDYDVTDIHSLSEPNNRPIVWVTWNDAQKFCTWLTSRWWKDSLIERNWIIRLPTENEWEKAARGGIWIPEKPVITAAGNLNQPEFNLICNPNPKRKFPWGDDENRDLLDRDNANYDETGLGIACSVGGFPKGISPYGVQDMSGNTWDWTQSLYINPSENRQENVFQKRKSDKVLKGGSFYFKGELTSCAFRGRKHPEIWGGDIGFRVVIAQADQQQVGSAPPTMQIPNAH